MENRGACRKDEGNYRLLALADLFQFWITGCSAAPFFDGCFDHAAVATLVGLSVAYRVAARNEIIGQQRKGETRGQSNSWPEREDLAGAQGWQEW